MKQEERIFQLEKDEKRKTYLFVTVYVFRSDHKDHVGGHQFSQVLNERKLKVY